MNGLLLLGITAVVLIGAYLLYGRYLVKEWGIDVTAKTPAVKKEDGVDYVPSNKWEVFAHQFLPIAGTAVSHPICDSNDVWLASCIFMDHSRK